MDSFSTSKRLEAADSIWDSKRFEVKRLRCASNNNYDKNMNEAGCDEVALGLIEATETEKKSQDKKKFDVEAMKKVEAMMGRDRGGFGISGNQHGCPCIH